MTPGLQTCPNCGKRLEPRIGGCWSCGFSERDGVPKEFVRADEIEPPIVSARPQFSTDRLFKSVVALAILAGLFLAAPIRHDSLGGLLVLGAGFVAGAYLAMQVASWLYLTLIRWFQLVHRRTRAAEVSAEQEEKDEGEPRSENR
jgi:hypothetical protein